MIALLFEPSAWAALATLIAMELVLGVDNLVFLALVSAKLPPERQNSARRIGLGVALALRLALLAAAAALVGLTARLFTLFGHDFSARDLVLLGGGFFLLFKATQEIHDHVEGEDEQPKVKEKASFGAVVAQIVALDLVFSIDSIVTAVGMTDQFAIMAISVTIAVAAMGVAAGPLSRFISANPSLVMLALSFLMMIGMVLIADGFGLHVPKGYIYAAFLFSGAVEALNSLRRARRRRRGGA